MSNWSTAQHAAVHSAPIRVYFEDTDAGGIVYYANYLKFAERARTEMLRATGASHSRMMSETGLLFAVRRCVVDYLRPARLDDELTVDTAVVSIGGASVDLRQRVRRADEDLAHLEVLVVCIGKDGKPARVPDFIRAAIGRFNGTP